MANYEVVVGNIGKVYEGGFYDTALAEFTVYKHRSIKGIGRASGEPVTLMFNDEIIEEYGSRGRHFHAYLTRKANSSKGD